MSISRAKIKLTASLLAFTVIFGSLHMFAYVGDSIEDADIIDTEAVEN